MTRFEQLWSAEAVIDDPEDDLMPATLNLDGLIPRDDFATQSEGEFEQIDRISVRDLEPSFFLNSLRKPDFQRETSSWTPDAVFDLIKSFVEGDLIPAVILWQSGGRVFVIDGAHRLSAVIAWVNNDYGDGELSKKLFKGNIPEMQLDIAKRARAMVGASLGSYADHTDAMAYPEKATPEVKAHVQRLATRSIRVQWVPGDDVKKAETSFFTINQAGTPINRTLKCAICGGLVHRNSMSGDHKDRREDGRSLPSLGVYPVSDKNIN